MSITTVTELSSRQISRRAIDNLGKIVDDAKEEAESKGVRPTEVWVGPREARALLVELNWQNAEARFSGDMKVLNAIISGNIEGQLFAGLRVRLMQKDGVRVGASYTSALYS